MVYHVIAYTIDTNFVYEKITEYFKTTVFDNPNFAIFTYGCASFI